MHAGLQECCFSAFWGGNVETMGTLCGELAKRRGGGVEEG